MDRGIDDSEQKELIVSTNMTEQVDMTEQLGGGISEFQIRPDDVERDEETQKPIPTRGPDRDGNVCEDSTLDLMSVNLSPDDVVSTMGQIHFLKARSSIIHQQRLFAAQVFELHRLIKVQKLIAESPDIMFDEGAYLGNLLKESAPKRVRVSHDVEPIPDIDRHEVGCEKTNKRIQHLEKAVEKTPISSSQIDDKLSTYKEQRSGLIGLVNGPRLPNMMTGNYLSHGLLRPHCPAFSPAISLPPFLIPSTPPALLSLDKMEALHKCYQNIYNMFNQYSELAKEVLMFSPSNNEVCASMANTSSHTTQSNPYTPTAWSPPCVRPVVPLLPPSSDSMYKMDYHHQCYQTLCNVLNQNSEFAREVMKYSSSISMASTSSMAALTNSRTLERVEQPGLFIFPTSLPINFDTSNQTIQDFKVLHQNAESETHQDESDTSFNSSDDYTDSDYLFSSSDASSTADDAENSDKETPRIASLMNPASDSMNNMDDRYNCNQSTCNLLNQNSGLAAEEMKLTPSKNLVVHASMACTSIQAAHISSSTHSHREFETPVVSVFPASPANNVGTPNQPTEDFKVPPDC